jgi:DNA-directed RNA polymerase specialized sigma24 family protein
MARRRGTLAKIHDFVYRVLTLCDRDLRRRGGFRDGEQQREGRLMRETVASLTPCLRRYAHALLGRWPIPESRAGAGRRADQDADDIAQEALLGFFRAGLLRRDGGGLTAQPSCAVKLALLRCVTRLTREASLGAATVEEAEGGGGARRDRRRPPQKHYPWAPEARALPRLSFESRALLALAALERLDYEEIGAVLDMSADQALVKLARARAEFASELTGFRQSHLRPASAVCEADLHGYADDLLTPRRHDEIAALLRRDDEAARRAQEWRRGAERLRGAFAALEAEPLPANLNFDRPPARRRAAPRRFWRRLLAWVARAQEPVIAAH